MLLFKVNTSPKYCPFSNSNSNSLSYAQMEDIDRKRLISKTEFNFFFSYRKMVNYVSNYEKHRKTIAQKKCISFMEKKSPFSFMETKSTTPNHILYIFIIEEEK